WESGVRIGDALHHRGEALDGGVLQRSRLQFGETEPAAYKARRRHVLSAELRLVVGRRPALGFQWLGDDRDRRAGDKASDLDDLVGGEELLCVKVRAGFDARVNEMADGERLDSHVVRFPDFTK